MSDTVRTTVYNPLDHSQIAFIPTTFDSDSDSYDDATTVDNDTIEAQLFHHYGEADMNKVAAYSSSAHSVSSARSSSSEDGIEILSQLSNAQSLASNVVDGIRYKIVLKLTAREVKLIRDSWELMLTEERSNETKSSSFFKRVFRSRSSSMSQSLSQSQSASICESNNKTKLKRVITGTSNHSSVAKSTLTVSTMSSSMSSSLFCAQFYSNFLAMDPNLEKAFPSLKHQATAFAGVLTMAINNLEDLSAMEAYLNNLGKRHARVLGIHPPQFELMGTAFLRTVRDRFGVYCTFELEETWARLYSYLANSILQFGIDPILKVDFEHNEIHLPIPNLIADTPTTTISLPIQVPIAQSNTPVSQKKNVNAIVQPSHSLPQHKASQSKSSTAVAVSATTMTATTTNNTTATAGTAASTTNEKNFFSNKLKGRSKTKSSSQPVPATSEDCIIM